MCLGKNMSGSPLPVFDRPLTDCPLCGSARIVEFDHDYQDRKISLCRNCALMFMNPQYTDEFLAEFYSNYAYRDPKFTKAEMDRRIFSKTNDLEMVERYVTPGRFLSVGCGDGLELTLARRRGWQVEGYDVDPQITRRVAGELGVPVHCGDFVNLGLPADRYDCIFLDQVLEHPKNPQEYLTEINRLLRASGVAFIGCPNIRSLSNVTKTFLGLLGLKKRRGSHYDMFHHLFYYSPRALCNVMRCYYGFEVLAVEGDPYAGLRCKVRPSLAARVLTSMRRRFPVFESTFRLVARKAAHPAVASEPFPAAA
jgi:SAM-dependent methyltransferase